MTYWLFILAGYLSGSVLYGRLLPKWWKGVDVCQVSEDGNPGTYNAFRYGGFACGVAVLLAELGKGALPVFACRRLVGAGGPLFSLVMAAPVLGHAHSIFYGGRGGKAIAVSFGVLIGMVPELRPLLFLIGCYLTFSLVLPIPDHGKRSIATFGCLLVLTMCFVRQRYVVLGVLIIALTVIFRHLSQERISADSEPETFRRE